MAADRIPTVAITATARASIDSSAPSVKTPRTARFAEATAVHSPAGPTAGSRGPGAGPRTNHYKPQPQPSDIGFGYLSNGPTSGHAGVGPAVEMEETEGKPAPAAPAAPAMPSSPLKSALKTPGAPPRNLANPLSPTFSESVLSPTWKEEQALEKEEEKTGKEQAKDLKVKYRVRMAKMVLRGVNFSCSLIVVAMLATVFTVFNATRHLPPRNNLPPWAKNTQTWPQIVLLVIASVSLAMSIFIFWAYFRGGHKRAEKATVYYTTFAVAFFVLSIVMWGIGAGILNQSKAQGNGQDLWGWSCKDNRRRALFADDVQYDLLCRLQDWALICCIIEIVVETLTIIIYGIVFYRYYSKRKLRKSMAIRDRARSDLYLAQLRSQSAPNTPGFGPLSPRDGGWRPPPGHPLYVDPHSAAEQGAADGSVQYASQTPRGFAEPKPFSLGPVPVRNSPKTQQGGGAAPSPPAGSTTTPPLSPAPLEARHQGHIPAAPGEQQYAAVPIPGAYASPLASPTFPAQVHGGFDFGLGAAQGRGQ